MSKVAPLDKSGSDSTIGVLESLLEDAHSGNVVGIAFVALRKRRQFVMGATGEARRNPVFARGMLACLDDALGEMTR
jgi:hypothetical protein